MAKMTTPVEGGSGGRALYPFLQRTPLSRATLDPVVGNSAWKELSPRILFQFVVVGGCRLYDKEESEGGKDTTLE